MENWKSSHENFHCTGFIQRRLDYIFISNSLQECINDISIFAFFSTDHSPVHLSLFKENYIFDFTFQKPFSKYNEVLKRSTNLKFTIYKLPWKHSSEKEHVEVTQEDFKIIGSNFKNNRLK